ncbi:hypothetical protein [Streptomyces sp. CdTB01]|uniref:hypothetical protein n=1 Tax=Streptomyces sp. CdTB01 TaxID=1725411 RepID=UPI00073A7724|nr:hypothetical protein [Streptomyces sp. CdTB01]ALV37952.1 hypothetical protein AS200_42310 [Streptomyces sp. CdTB01]
MKHPPHNGRNASGNGGPVTTTSLRAHEHLPHGDLGRGELPTVLPDSLFEMPSHTEIGSLIAATAAANLMLARRRAADRRLPHHQDDSRRSH